jgi:two-component system alkaline phosphatase synthesis response regulator PhoP
VKKRILLVEDDDRLADGLRLNLELDGYEPIVAQSAEEGLRYWERGGVDLILLDVMLPGADGFDLCRRIRAKGGRVPILFLTARGHKDDRIRGLESGGDDYIAKPFELRELRARIKSALRRSDWTQAAVSPRLLDLGDRRADLRSGEVTSPRGTERLGEKELGILRVLAETRGEAVLRHDLIDRVWGFDASPSTRTVDNFVVRLRKVLEPDPANPVHILTVRGVGYRLQG